MKENTAHVGIDSEIDYKIGDHIFTADFVGGGENESKFDVKEFEIKDMKKILGKPNYYEIVDIRFPKSVIKSDLQTGFFKSAKEAAKAFLDSIDFIHDECHKVYEKEYGKDNA